MRVTYQKGNAGQDQTAAGLVVRSAPPIHEKDMRALSAMLSGGNGLYVLVVHNGRIQKGPTLVPQIAVIDDAIALLESGGRQSTKKPRRKVAADQDASGDLAEPESAN